MDPHSTLNKPASERNLRGFVAYVALLLWFLVAILAARPASAADTEARLTAANLLPEIEAALIEKGMSEESQITLAEPHQPIDSVDIAHASFNPLSGRFIIRMENSAETILGVAHAVARIPVLNRNVARGELINESDIVFTEAPVNRARTIVKTADDLIGKTARRPLAAGSAIRHSDVTAPRLIEKGAVVTLSYQVAGMRMTHQGVALNNGAKGDIISVKNIESERTLKGVVADRNLVSIAPRNVAF